MLENFRGGNFTYKRLTEEEQSKRGILGRLEGVIADTRNPTRNGRAYSKDLWEKVFNDSIVKENITNRCCFCELGHPEDREEIDIEKVAACLAEMPKIGDDGNLYGVFDILPTPNGRILKALCDYGTTVGVSSRGTGDLITDDDGNEAVDPDTYDFKCFDIVLTPAVETARMNYVTESLDTNKVKLRKALKESIDKSSNEDKKVMLDTLKELNIELDEKASDNAKLVEQVDKACESEVQTKEKLEETVDDGTTEIIKNLQEALKTNKDLKGQLKNLQESLAISDAKVNTLNEDIERYKSVAERLGKAVRNTREDSKKLESIQTKLEESNKTIETLRKQNSMLVEEKKKSDDDKNTLNESVSKSSESIKKLNEEMSKQKKSYEDKIKSLKEEYTSKLNESSKQIERRTKLIEKYKKIANSTVDRYIDSKALLLGISSEEVKNKLGESFTLDEVDKVCEGLVKYNLNMSKLPFNLSKCAKVKVTESVEPLKKFAENNRQIDDDDVDETLLNLANMN